MPEQAIQRAAEAIRNGKCVIASTGAGISTESGIPDFRSADGIWAKYPPEEYATIDAFLHDPAKVWALWYELGDQFRDCKPNPAHTALAELEAGGRLHAIITQNVDNLHQESGSKRVIEYHGNSQALRCLDCDTVTPFDLGAERPDIPRCGCGGLLKPDVIMFGENIPPKVMLQAEGYARTADVVIIVGTSAQVFPAAQLPTTAKRNGAFVIESNRERTDFTETITDAFLEGRAGEMLPLLARAVLS